MTGKQIIHSISVDRDYYIARVGRKLEVRAQETHAVLQVLEPPREWGEDWVWSCSGFDGLRCVPLDCVRFVKRDFDEVTVEGLPPADVPDEPGPLFSRNESDVATRKPGDIASLLTRDAVAALRDWGGGHGSSTPAFNISDGDGLASLGARSA